MQLLTESDVAQMLKCTKAALRRWRLSVPKALQICPYAVLPPKWNLG